MKNSFIIAHKLLNTFESASFAKSITAVWVSYLPEAAKNVEAIQQKQTKLFQRYFKDYLKEDVNAAREYLFSLGKAHGICVKKAEIKGVFNTFTIDQRKELYDLIYRVINEQASFNVNMQFSVGRFNFCEISYAMSDYMVIKESVTTPSSNAKYENVKRTILGEKPASFFADGYLSDLFVCDQHNIHFDKEIKFIETASKHLSTKSCREFPGNNVGFDVYKLA